MTTGGRHIDELELDALLRELLAEDVDVTPRRIAEQAMAVVARTPQARLPQVLPQLSTRPIVSLWAAAAVIVAAILLVTSLKGPIIEPGATPSPSVTSGESSEPTVTSDGLVLFTSAEAGYEVLVPAEWPEVDAGYADMRAWEGPSGGLMVSYGASIFDGGAVTQCGPETPEWPRCDAHEYRYSIPYDPEVDGVAPLDLADYVRDRCEDGCDVTTSETTLGGEVAQQNSTVAAGLQATFVSTFHERRPVILYWRQPEGAADPDLVEQMRASFRFIAPGPGPEPTDFVDPTELVPFTNAELGYRLLIPRFWGDGLAKEGLPTVQEFGAGAGAGTRGDPALKISMGEPDGSIVLCQDVVVGCTTVVVSTLGELEQALVSLPSDFAGAPDLPDEESGDMVLGGEPGGWKRPGFERDATGPNPFGIRGRIAGNCLGCPGMLYHAFAIKDGRPAVISIDWWTIGFDELPAAYLEEILASFQFLD